MERNAGGRSVAARAEIRLITTDVDGTLLNSKLELTPKVEKAIKLSQSVGVPVLLATGKPPGGAWVERVFPKIGAWPQAGVFLQGTVVRGDGGKTIFTRDLDKEVIEAAIEFGKTHNLTICTYSMDHTLSERADEQIERLRGLGEPMPDLVPSLAEATKDLPVQKCLVMGELAVTDRLRPLLNEVITGRAEITTAIPGILEILPAGACKGVGVEELLKALDVPASDIMALGDGENDIDMLRLAGLGVHMGNAVPSAVEAADVGTRSNNDDGVAYAIEEHVLKPRGLTLDSALPA